MVSSRVFKHTNDFEAVQRFIAESFLSEEEHEFVFPTRLENAIFGEDNSSSLVHIWEYKEEQSESSKIIALGIIEGDESFFVLCKKEYKAVEKEIIEWAEEFFKAKKGESVIEKEIGTYALEQDKSRIDLLLSMGYKKDYLAEHTRTMLPPAEKLLFEENKNFEIKAITEEHYQEYVNIVALVFNHNFFTEDVYQQMRDSARYYIEDLNVGIFSKEGKLAAFCMIRIDSVTQLAELEPVGTHPDFRRLGLAQIAMSEAINRSLDYNPRIFCIAAAPTEPAAKLYEKLGFLDKKEPYFWSKKI